jgi:hypothetical protein
LLPPNPEILTGSLPRITCRRCELQNSLQPVSIPCKRQVNPDSLEVPFMPFHFSDIFTAANLLVLLGIYRRMSIIVFQHKLMWIDFAERKGISARGKHVIG